VMGMWVGVVGGLFGGVVLTWLWEMLLLR
jgi:cell division protein FtsX